MISFDDFDDLDLIFKGHKKTLMGSIEPSACFLAILREITFLGKRRL